MNKQFIINESKIKLEAITKISVSVKEINKILLLHYTNNLVCSNGEKVEIFENILIEEKSKQKALKQIQEIIDPNFNEIEFLFETKRNSNNKNYLLLCSDMIHIYYLFQNDKKSMLLQSINQFNFQYINQICETRSGNLVSVSNEYKISIFNNNLIKNNENIDYSLILNSGDDFIEKFREEIYELDKDKLNKDNEKIYYVLELFPDKLAYTFCIKSDDYLDNINTEDINDIDDDFIYIKFIDKNYNKIKELKICDFDNDYQEMFQLNEKTMIFINDNYLNLIDLKYYEIVTKIMTNKLKFTYPFQRNIDYLKNNYINYLLLIKEDIKKNSQDSNEESDDNNCSFENIKIDINNLTYILNDIVQEFEFEYKNEKISLNSLLDIYKILELTITGDKENNNKYFCAILGVCKNKEENNNLDLILFKFEIK